MGADVFSQVDTFLSEQSMSDWYMKYSWSNDSWNTGFPEIQYLEETISHAARQDEVSESHLQSIAEWGHLISRPTLRGGDYAPLHLYRNGHPASWIRYDPARCLDELDRSIVNFGPTYLSMLLRFAMPCMYGAMNTRIVTVFGDGDQNTKGMGWFHLSVQQGSIRKGAGWTFEYATWIHILRYIAQSLNEAGIPCPHPDSFVTAKLRDEGQWGAADVEMALFSYAGEVI